MLHFTSDSSVDTDIIHNLASAGIAQHEMADVNFCAVAYAICTCIKGNILTHSCSGTIQAKQWLPGLVMLGKARQGSTAQRQDVGRRAVEACMTMLQVRVLGLLQHRHLSFEGLLRSLLAVGSKVTYAD